MRSPKQTNSEKGHRPEISDDYTVMQRRTTNAEVWAKKTEKHSEFEKPYSMGNKDDYSDMQSLQPSNWDMPYLDGDVLKPDSKFEEGCRACFDGMVIDATSSKGDFPNICCCDKVVLGLTNKFTNGCDGKPLKVEWIEAFPGLFKGTLVRLNDYQAKYTAPKCEDMGFGGGSDQIIGYPIYPKNYSGLPENTFNFSGGLHKGICGWSNIIISYGQGYDVPIFESIGTFSCAPGIPDCCPTSMATVRGPYTCMKWICCNRYIVYEYKIFCKGAYAGYTIDYLESTQCFDKNGNNDLSDNTYPPYYYTGSIQRRLPICATETLNICSGSCLDNVNEVVAIIRETIYERVCS